MNTSSASEMVWNGIKVSTSLAAATVNQGMEFVTAELVFACSPIMQTEQEVYKETYKKSRSSVGKESKSKAKPQAQQEVYGEKSKKSASSVGKVSSLSDLKVKRYPSNEKGEKAPSSFSTALLDSLLTDENNVFPSMHHDHEPLKFANRESLKDGTPSRAQDIFRPRPHPLPLDDSERFGYLIPTDETDQAEMQRVEKYPVRDHFPERNRNNPQPALFDDEATMDTRMSSKSKASSTVISKIKSTVEPHVTFEQRMDGPETRQGHQLDSDRQVKTTQDARSDSHYSIIKTAVEPIEAKNQRMDGQEARQWHQPDSERRAKTTQEARTGSNYSIPPKIGVEPSEAKTNQRMDDPEARQGDELTGKRQKKDISSEIKELQRVVEMVERQRTLDRSKSKDMDYRSDSEKSRPIQTKKEDSKKMQELKLLMNRLERLTSRHKESKQQHSVHPVPQVLRSSDMQDQIKPRRLAHHSDTERDHIMEETTMRVREKVIENSRLARPSTDTTNAYYREQPKPEIIDLLGFEDTSSLVSSRVRSSYALATQ
jgi:hypothetical protein